MTQQFPGVFLWSFISDVRCDFARSCYVHRKAKRRFIVDEIVYNVILAFPQCVLHEIWADPVFIAYCKEQDRREGRAFIAESYGDGIAERMTHRIAPFEEQAREERPPLRAGLTIKEVVERARQPETVEAANERKIAFFKSAGISLDPPEQDRKPAGTPAPEFTKPFIKPVEYVVWEDGIEVEEQDRKEEGDGVDEILALYDRNMKH